MKVWTIVALLFVAGCSSNSPTAPTPTPITNTPPAASAITITGTVVAGNGQPVSGVTATIVFSGQTAQTNGAGVYSLTFVPRAGVPTTTITLSGATISTLTVDVPNVTGSVRHDVSTPLAAFPPNDPRFDMTFYQQFVHNALEARGALQPLRRQSVAPRIYLRTIDDGGTPIDAVTIDQTAAALINVAGSLTGVFGLAGLERGTDTRVGQPGWITVSWSQREETFCGIGQVGGDRIVLAPRTPGCRCSGNPSAIDQSTVKHELGHTLGFWHTDSKFDLMYHGNVGACDQNPSAREIYHAAVAYGRPIGTLAP